MLYTVDTFFYLFWYIRIWIVIGWNFKKSKNRIPCIFGHAKRLLQMNLFFDLQSPAPYCYGTVRVYTIFSMYEARASIHVSSSINLQTVPMTSTRKWTVNNVYTVHAIIENGELSCNKRKKRGNSDVRDTIKDWTENEIPLISPRSYRPSFTVWQHFLDTRWRKI